MSRSRAVVAAFALLLVGLAAFGAYVLSDVRRAGPGGERVRFPVPRGAPFASVAGDLEARGLVRHAWTLEFLAKSTGSDRRIHAGTYEFAPGTPALDILHALVNGDILAVSVTVPEGFTVWQVAGAFRAAGIDSVGMLAAEHDPELRQALQIPVESLEGYLFPDTYRVPFGSDPRDAVVQMLTRFHEEWTPAMEQRAKEMGMTRHQAVTLASIVEAEARVPDERPLVAAVYHNRLVRGMRLDADPTVAYALGGHRERLSYRDLEVDSAYNTYRHEGLPPGPICNPGASSMEAALHPDPSLRALYFVARGDGRHVFSLTLREHEAAVRAARRSRGAGGK